MERRLGIMQSVEPVLENAIKTLQKVVDIRGMGRKSLLQVSGELEDGQIHSVEFLLRDAENISPQEQTLAQWIDVEA